MWCNLSNYKKKIHNVTFNDSRVDTNRCPLFSASHIPPASQQLPASKLASSCWLETGAYLCSQGALFPRSYVPKVVCFQGVLPFNTLLTHINPPIVSGSNNLTPTLTLNHNPGNIGPWESTYVELGSIWPWDNRTLCHVPITVCAI